MTRRITRRITLRITWGVLATAAGLRLALGHLPAIRPASLADHAL